MLEIKDKEQSAIIALPYAARERVRDQTIDIDPGNYRYIYENAQRLQAEVNERKRVRAKKAMDKDDDEPKPIKKMKKKKI
jgi:hypothetical protein